jgi:hypothetical protein
MFEMKEGLFDIVNRPSFMVGIGSWCLFFSYCLNISLMLPMLPSMFDAS